MQLVKVFMKLLNIFFHEKVCLTFSAAFKKYLRCFSIKAKLIVNRREIASFRIN